jgi:hypothetical protein
MRRRFFLLAAPAIVAAPSLMKVSALVMPQTEMLRAVSNPIRYGSGLYSGYDGYVIAPSEWERFVGEITGISDLMRGAQSA